MVAHIIFKKIKVKNILTYLLILNSPKLIKSITLWR